MIQKICQIILIIASIAFLGACDSKDDKPPKTPKTKEPGKKNPPSNTYSVPNTKGPPSNAQANSKQTHKFPKRKPGQWVRKDPWEKLTEELKDLRQAGKYDDAIEVAEDMS